MSDYTHTRLEKDGTVVAYFAPGFEVNPVLKNKLNVIDRPKVDETETQVSIAMDLFKIRHEVTVQGVFEDSDNLPNDHKNALESLFGHSPVTAREQVNRLRYYMLVKGGAFELYEGSDEYTATSKAEADPQNGIYPTVFIDEIRPTRMGGHSRFNYTIKFVTGVEI